MSNISKLEKTFFQSFKPPKKLKLSDWADENFYLSAESSSEAGRWRSLPYQRGIMDAITDNEVEQVILMKSARVGYTKMINIAIAYHIHQDSCPIMVVQPTIEDAAGYSKEEISPMLRDVKCLQGLVSDPKAKDGSNTILQKNFPGGTLGLVGANSPRGFRRVSRRIVCFDECDGYPIGGAGTEGDQITLGIRRTEYYWNRKIIAGSTPTIKDFSRIEKMFLNTQQMRYHVPCPKCGHMQYLKWSQFCWLDNDPDTVKYKCESCAELIDHSQKRKMVEQGEWRATSASSNPKHIGFHIWAAYSYSPNASWSNLVEEFLTSKDDPEQLKVWINTILGETWDDSYQAKVNADGLMQRAADSTYTKAIPPDEALFCVAGIDTQDDRLSMSVFGIGREFELFLIDRNVIYGSPARKDVWKQLDEILLGSYETQGGHKIKILSSAIDTGGHYTQECYQYVRERSQWGLIGIKGIGTKGKPALGKPSAVDINYVGKSVPRGVKLYPVGVDMVKTLLHNKLRDAEIGSGYIHFYKEITHDYFEELTAEKQKLQNKNGFQERVWVKKNGARNEALDEMVYSWAALERLLQKFDRRTIFNQFERERNNVESNKESKLDSKKVIRPKRSNFVSNW